ncbi:helix-turn-helix transcriptional regulator [uncultured Thermomonospora sp.]|uniref:helix-turn-helix transcriptional regulator n=1 Tax=uncultured Thermomonospora sp. TaxID=671175 RepID=UPI00259B610E|nr:helix-turn-helix transcriptional regulator [uncultured Thermomonospora sp.]
MNDALRQALTDAGLTEADIAATLGVDPKTVQRWIAGRTPIRATGPHWLAS